MAEIAKLLPIIAVAISLQATAHVLDRNDFWEKDKHPDHCESTKEYVEALNFMRTQQDVATSEGKAREFALAVSKGCSGAAQRFAKVFLLMKKSGVDYTKALQVGLLFANETDETTINFYEIFQKLYLGEFFDLDYRTTVQVSLDLSRDYLGSREMAREDFLKIAKFCLDKKEMNLPARKCAELAVKFARSSQYYPKGVWDSFLSLYKTLREDKRFGLSIKGALDVVSDILPYGPTAPGNFISGFDYAIRGEGLNLPGRESIAFGIAMAKASVKEMPPPIFLPGLKNDLNLRIRGKDMFRQ